MIEFDPNFLPRNLLRVDGWIFISFRFIVAAPPTQSVSKHNSNLDIYIYVATCDMSAHKTWTMYISTKKHSTIFPDKKFVS